MKRPAKVLVAISAILLLTFALGATLANALIPSVTIENASEVGVSAAKVKGTVNPEGKETSFRFEYTPQAQFEAEGFTNAAQAGHGSLGAEEPETPVEATLEGLNPDTTYHLRLLAENEDGQSEAIAASTFETEEATEPTLTIDPASQIGYTVAHIEGSIDPEGGNTNPTSDPDALPIYWFLQYSKDPVNEGWSWGPEGAIEGAEAESEGPLSIEADFAPGTLTPNTTYEVRLFAYWLGYGVREVSSTSTSFTTLEATAPSVLLNPVSGVTAEAASFDGEVDPNAPESAPAFADVEAAFATEYRFECTPACPGTPDPQTIEADDSPQSVSFDPENLEPNTNYTVKLTASNKGGETVQEQSFETDALPPTLAAGTVGALSTNSARLTAYVDANNTATTATFEYDTEESFSSPATAPSGPGTEITGNGIKVAVADVSGLAPQQTYYWRVSVQSAEGTEEDTAPRGFTTWSPAGPDQGGVGVEGRRTLELVSTEPRTVPMFAARASEDGERALYKTFGGTGQSSYGANGEMLSVRTSTGWKTQSALPPRESIGGEDAAVSASTPDMKELLVMTRPGTNRSSEKALFRYRPDSGELAQGYTIPAHAAEPRPFTSDDLSHHVGNVSQPLVPEDVSARGGLYDFGSGEPELIGLLPGDVVPACGVTPYESNAEFAHESTSLLTQRWISEDGNRVFFHTRGNGDCTNKANLYMREGGVGGTTTLISGPPLSGPDHGGRFHQATPDGSQAFFSTASPLEPRDLNDGLDLYRYTVGEGNFCVTCAVPDARVITPAAPPGNEAPTAVVSEDGSRVYFSSNSVLAPGARPGALNTYVWRTEQPEQIEFVARTDLLLYGGANPDALTNPEGSALLFTGKDAELNRLTGTDNGGLEQLYRYDDRDRTLSCVSCPADGTTSSSAFDGLRFGGYVLRAPEQLTEDGRTVVFQTNVALAPEDVNGSRDVYEWHRGQVALVTDGATDLTGTSTPHLVNGLTADGRDLLFTSAADYGGPSGRPNQLYNARIGGGFPEDVPPAPCGGEGCRGAPTSPPGAPSQATGAFTGPGNTKATKPKCAKNKAQRKGRCVKKKAKKRQQGKQQGKRAGKNRGGSK